MIIVVKKSRNIDRQIGCDLTPVTGFESPQGFGQQMRIADEADKFRAVPDQLIAVAFKAGRQAYRAGGGSPERLFGIGRPQQAGIR
ncbi:MAG: hypothetical protein EBU46_21580 [Nitrosomonadaceae bacterium]|nr:hypothetical protein [Nitrosomonadaceae bacterium]